MKDKVSQVCDYLLDRIESGEFSAGEPIPSARKIGKEVNASFAMILHAAQRAFRRGNPSLRQPSGKHGTAGLGQTAHAEPFCSVQSKAPMDTGVPETGGGKITGNASLLPVPIRNVRRQNHASAPAGPGRISGPRSVF